ncbi:hypothetical protein GCM10009601_44530 [Streptomyces thermospinosisporus]|uniref:Uncharacterized protein n=1 Tax=Streptomyces thermospinosisporus TaxID=161482 RepID=A0ABP4JVZ1_9ACTN
MLRPRGQLLPGPAGGHGQRGVAGHRLGLVAGRVHHLPAAQAKADTSAKGTAPAWDAPAAGPDRPAGDSAQAPADPFDAFAGYTPGSAPSEGTAGSAYAAASAYSGGFDSEASSFDGFASYDGTMGYDGASAYGDGTGYPGGSEYATTPAGPPAADVEWFYLDTRPMPDDHPGRAMYGG